MSDDPYSKPSFSLWRKWSIALNVGVIVSVVLAVVVMVNYLSRDYFLRLHWSNAGKVELSTRTISVLKNLTNQVKITLYYDKEDPLYNTVSSLLKEYKLWNSKLAIQTVDFTRDTGPAQKIKTEYKLGSATEKNLVIFDCNGKVKIVDGKALADYTVEAVPQDKETPYRIKATSFKGEVVFTSFLQYVTSPKIFNAYFLQGHGEHRIDSGDERLGYMNFKAVLQQNTVQVDRLSLLGDATVPMDCDLLIIGGPTSAIPESELAKIEQYLNQGGRLMALFNSDSIDRTIGLESILANWGVAIGKDIIRDPQSNDGDSVVVVSAFSKHPIVNPLMSSGLYMVRPRFVGKLNSKAPQPADAAHVEPVAFTSVQAYSERDPARKPAQFPLIATVEKGAIKGVVAERGTTRMVIAGDSLFLANAVIDSQGNRDFAGYAVNWLLDRQQMLEGLGPKPIAEYRLTMSQSQLQSVQWLLAGAMPGSALVFGALVWLRRRK